MPLRFVCQVVIVLGAISFIIALKRNNEECGIQTSKNPAPWLVGIEPQFFVMKSKLLHTGALISRRHVIALNIHSYYFYRSGKPEAVYIGFHPISRCTTDSHSEVCKVDITKRVLIQNVTMITLETSNQISLITLKESIPSSDIATPICLPSVDNLLSDAADDALYFSGVIFHNGYYKIDSVVTALSKSDCPAHSFLFGNVTDDVICANITVSIPSHNSCPMHGGVLMKKKRDRYELVGLLKDNHCNVTKVFLNVSPFFESIRNKIPELAIEKETKTGRCGRRKLKHIEQTKQGEATKAGDWPWYAAINKLIDSDVKYICGGTLITKTMVLTAGYCATENGIPVKSNILSVTLGKHNLTDDDLELQKIKVLSAIVHKDFAPMNYLDDDIALLKLETEVTYNYYVQPACIWSSKYHDHFPSGNIYGTVLGWGTDMPGVLSTQLQQATIPKVTDITCISTNPSFYANVLSNEKKFCAGWIDDTSTCNRDRGSGFLVFVPDAGETNTSDAKGSWYIRGIVSIVVVFNNSTWSWSLQLLSY